MGRRSAAVFVRPLDVYTSRFHSSSGETYAALNPGRHWLMPFASLSSVSCPVHIYVKASESSREFYATAKKHVWQQSVTLSSMGIANLIAICIKNLTVIGRSTPLLTFTAQVPPHFLSTTELGSAAQWVNQGSGQTLGWQT